MGELSRGEFLRRLAAGTTLVAVPPSFLRQLERPAQAVATSAPVHPLVSEWWVESGEDMLIVQTARHTIYERHFIPARGGVHVRIPLGCEYEARDLSLAFKLHPSVEYVEMPLRLAMVDGTTRSYIANADGLEVYAGVVTIDPPYDKMHAEVRTQ